MKKVAITISFTLLLILIIVLGVAITRISSPNSDLPKIEKIELNEEILFGLIQEWRKRNNLKPYVINEALCSIANTRLEEIQNEFSHRLFLEHYAYKYPSKLGENLSYGYMTESLTLEWWLTSKSHKDNLEEPFIYSCIAIKDSYVVQIFSSCENGCP